MVLNLLSLIVTGASTFGKSGVKSHDNNLGNMVHLSTLTVLTFVFTCGISTANCVDVKPTISASAVDRATFNTSTLNSGDGTTFDTATIENSYSASSTETDGTTLRGGVTTYTDDVEFTIESSKKDVTATLADGTATFGGKTLTSESTPPFNSVTDLTERTTTVFHDDSTSVGSTTFSGVLTSTSSTTSFGDFTSSIKVVTTKFGDVTMVTQPVTMVTDSATNQTLISDETTGGTTSYDDFTSIYSREMTTSKFTRTSISVTTASLATRVSSSSPATSTTTVLPGHDEFVFDSYPQRVFIAVVLLVASIIGAIGNAIVIISVMVAQKLRSVTNTFVLSLSIADLLVSLCLPWNAVALLAKDGWPLPDVFCSTVAGILIVCVGCSVYTLTSIAVNRWLLITKSMQWYNKVFSLKIMYLWIALTWIVPFLATIIPPLAGFGELGYNHKYHTCSSVSHNPRSNEYDILTAVLLYPLSLLVIIVSYVKIFLYVRQHSLRLGERKPNGVNSSSIDNNSDQVVPKTVMKDHGSTSVTNLCSSGVDDKTGPEGSGGSNGPQQELEHCSDQSDEVFVLNQKALGVVGNSEDVVLGDESTTDDTVEDRTIDASASESHQFTVLRHTDGKGGPMDRHIPQDVRRSKRIEQGDLSSSPEVIYLNGSTKPVSEECCEDLDGRSPIDVQGGIMDRNISQGEFNSKVVEGDHSSSSQTIALKECTTPVSGECTGVDIDGRSPIDIQGGVMDRQISRDECHSEEIGHGDHSLSGDITVVLDDNHSSVEEAHLDNAYCKSDSDLVDDHFSGEVSHVDNANYNGVDRSPIDITVGLGNTEITRLNNGYCSSDTEDHQPYDDEEDQIPLSEITTSVLREIDQASGTKSETTARRTTTTNSGRGRTGTFEVLKNLTLLPRLSQRELQITKNMFYIVVAFLLCFTPFTFCLFFDDSDKVIPYAGAIVFMNSCINPIIYATKHPHFKQIFALVLRCRWSDIAPPSPCLRAMIDRRMCCCCRNRDEFFA